MIPFTDEELMQPVHDVIEKVRPSLALDGGDIRLLGVRNGVIYVQLRGACVGCGSAGNTLKYGVERQIRMDIHPDLKVVNLPEGMENQMESVSDG